MNKNVWLVGVLAVVLLGCATADKEKIYKNQDFSYSLTYPAGFQTKAIKWVKEETGLELKRNNQTITIQALPTGTDYAAMPFDRYARIAATVDIQNFTKLLASKPFISDYKIGGFETYWEVIEHEDTDAGEIDQVKQVGPIYYFPLAKAHKLGDQPVKAVMLYPDPALTAEAAEIAASFRHLNSFITLLRAKQHGKLFFARRDRPFRIELAANPTTGYNWYIAAMDESRFRVRRSGYDPEATGRVGGGGTSFWEVVPLKEGLGTIKLLYYRVWEGPGKAVDTFQVRVIVL